MLQSTDHVRWGPYPIECSPFPFPVILGSKCATIVSVYTVGSLSKSGRVLACILAVECFAGGAIHSEPEPRHAVDDHAKNGAQEERGTLEGQVAFPLWRRVCVAERCLNTCRIFRAVVIEGGIVWVAGVCHYSTLKHTCIHIVT